MDSTFDNNLRLGDIREYDCTLGYRQSGVTVQWVEYTTNKLLNNPLILTMNQSVNNAYYTCIVTIDKNPTNCLSQKPILIIKIKGMLAYRSNFIYNLAHNQIFLLYIDLVTRRSIRNFTNTRISKKTCLKLIITFHVYLIV